MRIVNDKGETIIENSNWLAIREELYDKLIDGNLPGYRLEAK